MTRCLAVDEAVRPLGIEGQHPVSQGLQTHPAEAEQDDDDTDDSGGGRTNNPQMEQKQQATQSPSGGSQEQSQKGGGKSRKSDQSHDDDQSDQQPLPPVRYYETSDLDDAFHPQTILAYDMNEKVLPVQHGAPLRLRLERQLGYKMAKYVMRLSVVESYDQIGQGKGGYWEDKGYAWYAGI